jgi:chemotaxis protein methyltransferase CheR
MKHSLPDNILLQLSEFISSNLALHFPKERWDDLERNIVSASKEFGYSDTEKFIQHIFTSPLTREYIEILAANLTINETYFWREPQTFEALEQTIIPELIRNRQYGNKRLRIWSAGCSTGEEPYSIAIALKRTIPDIKNWNISILATDINPRILRKAAAGEYTKWSFRGVPKWLKENYFVQKPDNKLGIIQEIREMVTYEYLNLAEDIYPSSLNDTNAMDIIYCRNVLMYFTQSRFRQVARGLFNSLIPGGYLVVSASELSMLNFPDFVPVNLSGITIYQKTSKKIIDRHRTTVEEIPIIPITLQVPQKPEYIFKWINPSSGSVSNTIKKGKVKSVSQKINSELSDKSKLIDPASDEYILLIRSLANQGKLTEAIELSKSAIASNKIDPRLHYLYATILRENDQVDEAIASLKRALFLNSNFVLAYYSLEKIYEHLGDFKNAKKCNNNVLSILNKYGQDDILFESEGLTAGRFKEIVNTSNQTRVLE